MTEGPRHKPKQLDEHGRPVERAGRVHDAESVDERLARLAGATADVRPSAGLTDWILHRIDADRDGTMGDEGGLAAGLGRHLWRTGRVALAGFAAAAIACVIWSMHAETSFDEGVLATFDVVEVGP